jgi:endonuclease/exonuclease/phosphatase family metal-dependent hydrolase
MIKIAIRPSIALPRVFKHSLAEKLEEEGQTPPLAAMATRTEYLSLQDEEEVESNPTSFFTWNLNGLGKRLENKDLESKLYSQIDRLQPDVIGLQEVKLPRESDLLKDTVRKGGKNESNWEDFYYAPLKANYDAYLSLLVVPEVWWSNGIYWLSGSCPSRWSRTIWSRNQDISMQERTSGEAGMPSINRHVIVCSIQWFGST